MGEQKLTFYERHPVMAKTGIALGLVGILGMGTHSMYAQQNKEESKAKQEQSLKLRQERQELRQELRLDIQKLMEKYRPKLQELQKNFEKEFPGIEAKIQEALKNYQREDLSRIREELRQGLRQYEEVMRELGLRMGRDFRPMRPGQYGMMRERIQGQIQGRIQGRMQRPMKMRYDNMRRLRLNLDEEAFKKMQEEMSQLREKHLKERQELVREYIK
ncbi:hypothetical protein JXB28_00795 [Candidatus Woesearchaeota archaeon]|nr:hypothetical protein [Candidatus Woesearchaeota archaeon]